MVGVAVDASLDKIKHFPALGRPVLPSLCGVTELYAWRLSTDRLGMR